MAFCSAYLTFFAILMAMIVIEENEPTPSSFFVFLPFVFIIDFGLRFLLQQTPTQMVRPYLLLPIPKLACIDAFIVTQLSAWENFLWQFFFTPFAIMTILPREGFGAMIGFILATQFVICISSQFYILVRTRLFDSIIWTIPTISILALLLLPLYIKGTIDFEAMVHIYGTFGTSLSHFSPIEWLLLISILGGLIFLNRREQYVHIMSELSHEKESDKHHINSFSFFKNFGTIGLFMQLETKLILRNKHPRKQIIFISALILFFLLATCFGAYQDAFGQEFWCFYAFLMIGSGQLQKLMMYEGNYIDLLMTQKEKIYELLVAKYYFYSLLLLFPAILCIPTIVFSQWTILQCIAYLLYTCGPIYFMMFQFAVFNNQTLPLDANLMTRTHTENQGTQVICTIIAIGVPMVISITIKNLFSPMVAYIILIALSMPFIITHRLWIKDAYHKMMKRRYKNIAAFHETR